MSKTVKKIILGTILGTTLIAGGAYAYSEYSKLQENAVALADELKETQKQKEQEIAKRAEVENALNETRAALDKAEKDKNSSKKEVSELKDKIASLEQELSFKIAARQEAERQAAEVVEASTIAYNNTQSQANYSSSGGKLTPSGGVFHGPSGKETYYSQRVLPGGGLNIPGRHVVADGTIRDADGYVVIASDVLPKGSITETSLGTGKVYDTGVGHAGVDIYTNW